ncbi:MAG TPA: M23 family metallopeptidase, partial [Pyrinomonadaceae bacterium]|nr:M23 family metallopeptidase [Pyrinomonadaceae bacterium]
DHGGGLTTRYGHLSQIDVELDQTVQRAQLLGKVGSTGRSTGPHLHYEVRINDQPVNPRQYLLLNNNSTAVTSSN